jgi:hypothetical protein
VSISHKSSFQKLTHVSDNAKRLSTQHIHLDTHFHVDVKRMQNNNSNKNREVTFSFFGSSSFVSVSLVHRLCSTPKSILYFFFLFYFCISRNKRRNTKKFPPYAMQIAHNSLPNGLASPILCVCVCVFGNVHICGLNATFECVTKATAISLSLTHSLPF